MSNPLDIVTISDVHDQMAKVNEDIKKMGITSANIQAVKQLMMSEEQKKQYMLFMYGFLTLLHEDGVSREVAQDMGLSALSAYCGAVITIPEIEQKEEELGLITGTILKQLLNQVYGSESK